MWTISYVDEMKPDPKKGQMCDEWGLYVDRPFFIVSALPEKRYLDLIGTKLVIKTPNGRPSQSWFFDYKSKTIRSRA